MSDASRILRLLGLVFAAIGLVVLAVGVLLAGRQMLATDGMLPSQGEVVAFQNRRPVVRFAISDTSSITIVGGTASTPPAYDIGQKLRVLYNPARPTDAVIDTFLERWFVPTLLGGLGALFAVLGLGFLIYTARHNRRIAWLRRHGMKVSGRIVEVVHDSRVQLNRRPTWQILAEWSANGISGRAASFHLMRDPQPLLGARTAIDVWVDPANPARAWVDTDFLDPPHAVAQALDPVQRR